MLRINLLPKKQSQKSEPGYLGSVLLGTIMTAVLAVGMVLFAEHPRLLPSFSLPHIHANLPHRTTTMTKAIIALVSAAVLVLGLWYWRRRRSKSRALAPLTGTGSPTTRRPKLRDRIATLRMRFHRWLRWKWWTLSDLLTLGWQRLRGSPQVGTVQRTNNQWRKYVLLFIAIVLAVIAVSGGSNDIGLALLGLVVGSIVLLFLIGYSIFKKSASYLIGGLVGIGLIIGAGVLWQKKPWHKESPPPNKQARVDTAAVTKRAQAVAEADTVPLTRENRPIKSLPIDPKEDRELVVMPDKPIGVCTPFRYEVSWWKMVGGQKTSDTTGYRADETMHEKCKEGRIAYFESKGQDTVVIHLQAFPRRKKG